MDGASVDQFATTIAPNYDDLSFPVSAGSYCWYSGTLYKAKQDIASSESWTAAHWETAVFAEDVAALHQKADALAAAITQNNAVDLTAAEYATGYIDPQNVWQVQSQRSTFFIPVPDGAVDYTVTANAEEDSIAVVIKKIPTADDEAVELAPGSVRTLIHSGETQTFNLPTIPNSYVTPYYLALLRSYAGTVRTPESVYFATSTIPVIDDTLSIAGNAADAKATGDRLAAAEEKITALDALARLAVEMPSWALSTSIDADGSVHTGTDYKTTALSSVMPIVAPLYRGGSLKDSNNVDLNMYVVQYNGTTFISRTLFNTLNQAFTFDPSCTRFRILFGRSGSTGVTMTQTDVDTYCKLYTYLDASGVPKIDDTLFVAGDAADAKAAGDAISAISAELHSLIRLGVDMPSWTLSASIDANGQVHTGSSYSTTALSSIMPVVKPLYRTGALKDANNNTIAMYIVQYNGTTFIERTAFNVLDQAFDFDENCNRFRVFFGRPSATGIAITQTDIDTYFGLYTYIDIPQMYDDVETLKSYHPSYAGKKVSILGDSISTFVYTADKVDGRAPAGCTTTYPGNVTQYQNSDVTSPALTWWGRVIDQFGMVLGINESWAGSTIGYNSSYTDSGKYTADNCMCSAARIGHLGENGTPDLIIIFGGTNDINHHKDGSHTRFAVGELDTTHNPYDFDNFPMVTDTYYGAITTMLLRIQHSYPNATILMLLPYFCTYTHTSSGDLSTPYDQQVFADVAMDVCRYLGVEYLDLRQIINLYDVSSLLFDGLHPKAAGMAAIAKAVVHKLNNML